MHQPSNSRIFLFVISIVYLDLRDFSDKDFNIYFSICTSMKKDAIEDREDFTKNHPTQRDHDFGFEKNHQHANDISKAIDEPKLQSKSDTIVKIKID